MIICIGNALVDALEQIDEEVVDTLNLNKARMTLVDKDRSSYLLSQMNKPSFEAGGSAANTAYWISKLGGSAGFIGRVSNDNLGKTFKESLKKTGLQDLTITEDEAIQTGLCAIFITPDGERTMNTYLGAGEFLSPSDINLDDIEKAEILYMEGYLWDKPDGKDAFVYASEINKKAGGKNAITLSDVFCVEAHRDSFKELIKNNIDYVFCNEDELNSLTMLDDTSQSFEYFLNQFPNVEVLVCTLGSKGSLVLTQESQTHIEAAPASVVDKTGAGDFFAAGFLYGIQKGLNPEESAEIGNKSAAHVISEIGVRPSKNF